MIIYNMDFFKNSCSLISYITSETQSPLTGDKVQNNPKRLRWLGSVLSLETKMDTQAGNVSYVLLQSYSSVHSFLNRMGRYLFALLSIYLYSVSITSHTDKGYTVKYFYHSLGSHYTELDYSNPFSCIFNLFCPIKC